MNTNFAKLLLVGTSVFMMNIAPGVSLAKIIRSCPDYAECLEGSEEDLSAECKKILAQQDHKANQKKACLEEKMANRGRPVSKECESMERVAKIINKKWMPQLRACRKMCGGDRNCNNPQVMDEDMEKISLE